MRSDLQHSRHPSLASTPGERLAAWWLTLGRSRDQIVADLVAKGRLSEDEAWVAVQMAQRTSAMAAHPSSAGTGRRAAATPLRLVSPVL